MCFWGKKHVLCGLDNPIPNKNITSLNIHQKVLSLRGIDLPLPIRSNQQQHALQ